MTPATEFTLWQKAIVEAEADLANAETWQQEKSFRWYLGQLIAWGEERGFHYSVNK